MIRTVRMQNGAAMVKACPNFAHWEQLPPINPRNDLGIIKYHVPGNPCSGDPLLTLLTAGPINERQCL